MRELRADWFPIITDRGYIRPPVRNGQPGEPTAPLDFGPAGYRGLRPSGLTEYPAPATAQLNQPLERLSVLPARLIFILFCDRIVTVFESVAVVGATGAVGTIIRELLEKRNFPAEQFTFLASARSAGSTLKFRGTDQRVKELTADAFAGVELVIASTPDDTAAEFLPAAVAAGAKVIDESGYFRMQKDVALVVPEINPDDALNARGIISSPNCSTTQMVLALKPLHDAAQLKRVVVATYQATSGAGLQGNRDLEHGSRAALDGRKYAYQAFAHPIAFNAIPQIGGHREAGYTSEEMKMVYETRKILGLESLPISPTCVRIPVSNCHSEVITVETERPVSPDEARELFSDFPGLTVVDDLDSGVYPMPSNSSGSDETFIGRIRRDLSHPNGLTFWCVSDNLRKGAATNAVQIAELLAKHR